MKRFFTIIFLSLVMLPVWGMSGADSLQLGILLEKYVAALDGEPFESKNAECDFILASCPDSATFRFTLRYLFDYYSGSKNMEDENVAVHLVDSHNLKDFDAKYFAYINRSCLIGAQAPELELNGSNIISAANGKFHILYFFDKDCSKCKLEGALLEHFMESTPPYNCILSRIDVKDLPEDATAKYSLVSTPRIFFLDPNGVILGRKLDTEALAKLAKVYNPYAEVDALTDNLSRALAPDSTLIMPVAKKVQAMTADTTALGRTNAKCAICALQNYLMLDERRLSREAHAFLVNDVILPLGQEYWNAQEDSIQVIYTAELYEKLYSLNPIGSRLPSLKVTSVTGVKKNVRRLRYSYLIYMLKGCWSCEKKLEEYKDVPNCFIVDVSKQSKEVQDAILEMFDISSLPLVIKVDKKGRVEAKYL